MMNEHKRTPASGVLGVLVRTTRDSRGLTMANVAKLSGVSITCVKWVEHGHRVRWRTITAICGALGIEPKPEYL